MYIHEFTKFLLGKEIYSFIVNLRKESMFSVEHRKIILIESSHELQRKNRRTEGASAKDFLVNMVLFFQF